MQYVKSKIYKFCLLAFYTMFLHWLGDTNNQGFFQLGSNSRICSCLFVRSFVRQLVSALNLSKYWTIRICLHTCLSMFTHKLIHVYTQAHKCLPKKYTHIYIHFKHVYMHLHTSKHSYLQLYTNDYPYFHTGKSKCTKTSSFTAFCTHLCLIFFVANDEYFLSKEVMLSPSLFCH